MSGAEPVPKLARQPVTATYFRTLLNRKGSAKKSVGELNNMPVSALNAASDRLAVSCRNGDEYGRKTIVAPTRRSTVMAETNRHAIPRTAFHFGGITKAGCVLTLLTCASLCLTAEVAPPAVAASAAEAPVPTSSAKHSTTPPKISYEDGQLTIHAIDLTLADVLEKVAAVTGLDIDIPESTRSQLMPLVQFGPGPAREILSSLLNDANFDYLIQESDTEPDKLQSVLILPRKKKGGAANGMELAARPSHSPLARVTPAKSDVTSVPDNPPAQAANTTAEASASNPQPSAPQDQLEEPPSREPSNLMKSAELTPPPIANPQNANQTLQQMYQQRMQMIQQSRQQTPR